MINWKVVVGSGVVAGVLSLLTGIIGGVSFGTLLVRALMWGAIFCVVGGGVSLLIAKYLPELFSAPAEGEGKGDESRRNVDIVLPDENPHRVGEEYESEESPYDVEEAHDIEELQDTEVQETRAAQPEPVESNNLIEEVEELPGDIEASSAPRGRSRPARDPGRPEPKEDLPDFGTDESDLSSLGETSDLEPEDNWVEPDITRSGPRIEVLGHQADPEEIARAIRTTLSKDQKG